MEVLQAQLASDLNSNCYLVLMNEVLKSGWMIEYNNNNHHHSHTGKLSSREAEDVGDVPFAKEAEDVGPVHTVIEIDDDDSSPEDEPSSFRTPDQRQEVSLPFISLRGESTESVGKRKHYNIIGGSDTEIRSIELYEREKGCGSGAISDVVAPTRGPGPYQRPARIIQSPDWLPDGWTTEIRIRELGNTAGTKDKYYVDPSNGRRFRSKKEVMEYLQTGNLSRWKRKAKPAELNSNCPSFEASVAQVECPSATLQNWSISPFAWGPLQVANNYVNIGSVPYNGGGYEKLYSSGSWVSTNQQNNVFNNAQYHSSHIARHPIKADFVPQFSFHPQPIEIIDLEAIPDTTPSIEIRPVSKKPKEVLMPVTGSKGQEAKDCSSKLHSYDKHIQSVSKKKQLHIGEPSGGFTSIAAFDNNRPINVPQISPLPSLGSPFGSATPLLWQYRMFLPSFPGNHALGQIQSPGSILHENDVMIGTKSCGQVQLQNADKLFEKDSNTGRLLPEQRKKPSIAPLGVKKLQKLKRHQEKKQLELLGKKLCWQGLAFMRNELPTQS
ncbi:hypothetical protein O6H91_13G060500 [Diphasiastrum complanatum]|uniref:Uncharacterized protein n=1 Tax=Diphasiastrum complanatum TaxID=34168 RepID=A0ACC2BVA9_DIPCM|nr:hypothetical protein O6H91_13G060500 [Diphasiastrum complanatum]